LLESGPHLTPDDFVNDEWAAHQQLSWLDRRTASGGWRVAEDHPDDPVWHCEVVGGTTTHWSGCCLRLQPHEMRAATTYGSVPGASLIDWPISFADLEPWYELAETKMGVTRTGGRPGLPANNNFKVMYHGAKAIGLDSVNTGRHAINSEPFDGRPATDHSGFTVQGDKTQSKWSTLYVEIPKALKTGKLELRAQCRALRVEHDAAGRASGVLYADKNGAQHFQKARVVVLAANCVESSRLLLNSHSGLFPQGLANGWGHVGRHYLRHIIATVWSVFPEPVRMYRGETMAGLATEMAAHDPARGFVGGYYIELNAMGLPATAAFVDPGWWGRDFACFMEHYAHVAGLFITGEDMPQPDNRVTLDGDQTDRFGVPIANLHYDDHANDVRLRNHGYKKLSAMHQAVGALRTIEAPPYPASHNLGSNRMSAKPEDGVLDAHGRAHEMANLFIADGSQFASGGAGNPTLTIVALAMRQAEYMAALMSAGEL